MLRMLPLLGWVLIPDCWALRGPDAVRGYTGGSLSVSCKYEKRFRDNTKFWCKQSQYVSTCSWSSIIRSDSDEKVEKGRVSIEDKKKDMYFTVTMDNLQLDDSGTYQCGIERIPNIRHNIIVTVSPAHTSKPEEKSVTTELPHPDHGDSMETMETTTDVTKSSPIPRQGPSKPHVILIYCIVVMVILLLLATAVLVITSRKRRTGSCLCKKKERKPSNIVTVYSTAAAPREFLVPDHPTTTANGMELYSNAEFSPESNGEKIHSQKKALEERNEVDYATLVISDLQQQEAIYANVDPTPSPGLPQTPTQDVFYAEVKKTTPKC